MANIEVWKIYRKCEVCWGTGVTYRSDHDGEVEITCPQCNGATVYVWGYIPVTTIEIEDPGV